MLPDLEDNDAARRRMSTIELDMAEIQPQAASSLGSPLIFIPINNIIVGMG